VQWTRQLAEEKGGPMPSEAELVARTKKTLLLLLKRERAERAVRPGGSGRDGSPSARRPHTIATTTEGRSP
jgi:hypothetical protein